MKAASLVVSILETLLVPFFSIFYLYVLKDVSTQGMSYEERQEEIKIIDSIIKYQVLIYIVVFVVSVSLLVLARILIAKKHKIPAAIITMIFVSRIGGLLTFFISYDEDKKIEPENYIPVEEEETNETRSRNKCPFCGKVVSKFDEFCPHCKHKFF